MVSNPVLMMMKRCWVIGVQLLHWILLFSIVLVIIRVFGHAVVFFSSLFVLVVLVLIVL